MGWKPKEKELTEEEARKLARHEAAPFWIGSEPHFTAARLPEKRVALFPLSAEFENRPWLLFFTDLTEQCCSQLSIFAREWHRRYHPLNLGMVGVLSSRYTELRIPETAARLTKKHGIPFPTVIDQDGLIAESLGVATRPQLVLISEKRVVFSRDSRQWHDNTELEIQNFLRATDPGLSLRPSYEPEFELLRPLPGLEFGRAAGERFPAPGFGEASHGLAKAKFEGPLSGALPARGGGSRFTLIGQWFQDADRIATSDPSSAIAFHSPGRQLAVIARSMSQQGKASRISVELSDTPVPDSFHGAGLALDDEGLSSFQAGANIDVFPILSSLPPGNRAVTLRFPEADQAPVAIYGLRFAD